MSHHTTSGGDVAGGLDYHEPPEPDDPGSALALAVVPDFGPAAGGTRVEISGLDFAPGATVTFGTVPATEVVVVHQTLITAMTPPAEAGWVDVVVTNPNGRLFTLRGGFTYTAAQLPDVAPTMTITELGTSPKAIEVRTGSRVTIVNNDSRPHDMRSDPHPFHTDCPELNEVGVVQPGASAQSGAFLISRVCGFHDHSEYHNEGLRGRIAIKATAPVAPAPMRPR